MHIKELDRNLLNLAWSLWTELGVAGVLRNHQKILILVEELILFTSVLSESDSRLRDESMDWCAQFHRFISISRLRSLMDDFKGFQGSFSKFAVALNAVSNANWPVIIPTDSLKISLSGKSSLRPYASPALLNMRARSIFGTGSRADLITFFLVHPNSDFSVSEAAEIGYSKRNLADVLIDLHFGKLFGKFMHGNQQRYFVNRESPIFQMLQPIPEYPRSWRLVFEILLSLRSCLIRIQNYAESTQVIEIRNCLDKLEGPIQKLDLHPPSFQNNFSLYLESFSKWILEWSALLAAGE